jgi:predicted MFS family arabinose efflux permease
MNETFHADTPFFMSPTESDIPGLANSAARAASAPLAAGRTGLTPRQLWAMAAAAGLVMANMYYNQPLLADMARTFHASVAQIGWVAMLTQAGSAAGVVLVTPLGDATDRRRLLMIMCFIALAALAGVAVAPNLAILGLASFALGVGCIVPQLLLPFAAHLARPEEQGRAVGIVLGGLLVGAVLGRIVGGYVGRQLGWRAMYWIATGIILAVAVVLRAWLPRTQARTGLSYGRLLLSLGRLLAEQPVLRETAFAGAMLFGSINVFWSTLIFRLESPPYHYGSQEAGLIGLAGLLGALSPSVSGRWADKGDARRLTLRFAALALLAFVTFWTLGHHLWWLILGAVALDIGCNSGSICCHARNYRLLPNATNRAATIYITMAFVGGSLGTKLATYAFQRFGYSGVCAVGVAMLSLAVIILLLPAPQPRPAAGEP